MRVYNLNWRLQQSSIAAQAVTAIPVPYSIGTTIQHSIMPHETFNLQLNVYSSMQAKFNVSIASEANTGLYMQKDTLPTLTKFDYFQAFTATHAFVHHLDKGPWFISILNDNDRPLTFRLRAQPSDTSRCPQNCHGRGDCSPSGQCRCFTGFSGPACAERACPVMCSGNGVVENGKCSCNLGFHGADCQLTLDKCEVPDCSNNGDCVQGKCSCRPGFTGQFCDQVACLSANCSNNGVCSQQGTCQCFAGYAGQDCSQAMPSLSGTDQTPCFGFSTDQSF